MNNCLEVMNDFNLKFLNEFYTINLWQRELNLQGHMSADRIVRIKEQTNCTFEVVENGYVQGVVDVKGIKVTITLT